VDERVRSLTIFVSSPGDVLEERRALARAVDELNRHVAPESGFVLRLVDWETHVRPAMGEDAQDVINRQIPPYDALVGIMWHRFGTPTGRASSGTEEEFRLAYARWRSEGKPEIMFYFNRAPCTPATAADSEQQKRVALFRRELRRTGLVWDYCGTREFESLVRNHLLLWLVELRRAARAATPAQGELRIGDIEVQAPKLWSSSNVVMFSLWYLGDGLAFVKDLGIDVADYRAFPEIKMLGKGAIPEEHTFELALKPEKGTHRVNSRPFVYRRGELDTFRLELRSSGGLQYDIRLYASWHDKIDERPRMTMSPMLTVSFPVSDVDEAIRLAKERRPR